MSAQTLPPPKQLYAPDRVQRLLYALVQDFYKKRTQYLVGAVCFLLLGLGGWGWAKYAQTQKIKQANLFYAAQKVWTASSVTQNAQDASGIQAMQGFVASNKVAVLNHIGYLRLGESYAQQQKWAEAEASFQKIVHSKNAPVFLKNNARISLVSLKEQQGQWKDAKLLIQEISGSSWNDVRLRLQARIALSTGKQDKAKQFLEDLVNLKPISPLSQEADQLLKTF